MYTRLIFRLYILVSVFFLPIFVSAEQSQQAKNISNMTPSYISDVSVTDEGDGVRISGKTADLNKLSTYMRFLDENVGAPLLQTVTRKENVSVFVIQLKKVRE